MENLSPRLFIICCVLLGQFLSVSIQFSVPLASGEADLIELQETQRQERACLVKFDRSLAKLWGAKLNETSVNDVGAIPEFWSLKEPGKPKYNTLTQEWLMEDADPISKLRGCSSGLLESVSNKLDQETRACADKLFKRLVEDEKEFVSVTEKLLNDETVLPFREFLSFLDIEAVVYQNRSVENLTSHENNTHGHMASFVPSDEDKRERAWILRQECDWEDLKELREAKDDNRVFELFRSQVLRAVDYVLGNQLVRNIDVFANISHANYTAFLETRKNMLNEIETIVDEIKSVKNDSRRICKHANEVGNKFALKQAAILLSKTEHHINLKANEVTVQARSIEKHLASLNDSRSSHFDKLANEFEGSMHCFNSLNTMLIDHERYELIASFIGKDLSYPQIFCRQMNLNLGLLAPMYCKCVGSFCVSHDIAALFSERFELRKNTTSGVYSVLTANIDRPTREVASWSDLKEI